MARSESENEYVEMVAYINWVCKPLPLMRLNPSREWVELMAYFDVNAYVAYDAYNREVDRRTIGILIEYSQEWQG